jgi:hypothetical protein
MRTVLLAKPQRLVTEQAGRLNQGGMLGEGERDTLERRDGLAERPAFLHVAVGLGEAGRGRPEAPGVDAATARKTIIAGIGGFATGRFTTPEEVATLITFLASDRTANITGANYVIDGGLIKTT